MQAATNSTETPEIRQLGTFSIDRITLEPSEIKYFWAVGILNDVAYIALALQVDKRMYKCMKSLNINAFAERWAFSDEEGVTQKMLKPKQIRDAIHKLEAVDYIKVDQQLSLELNY